MAYSRLLSGIYNGRLYDKTHVMKARLYDSCYFFDMADGCRFIASRAPYKERNIGESIYDIMTEDDVEVMRRHLMSYTAVPMAVNTSKGIAIALPHLVPHCSLGILSYPIMGGENFCRVARKNKWNIVMTDSLSHRRFHTTELSDTVVAYCEQLERLHYHAFGGLISSVSFKGDITSEVEKRIYSLSEYIGCPVGIVLSEPIEVVGDFQFPLFVAFAAIFMICAREVAPNREASVKLDVSGDRICVTLSFMTGGSACEDILGLEYFKALSERKHMRFEYMAGDNLIHIKFAPMGIEWSLMGLKSPGGEMVDSNATALPR